MACDFNPRWFWTKKNICDIKRVLEGCDLPIFHVCSGTSSIGEIRLDRSYIDVPRSLQDRRGNANVLGDMERLPFRDGIASTVLCDPPYKYNFTQAGLIDELARICRSGGKIVFVAPWVPNHLMLSIIKQDMWKVGKNRPYQKILTVFRKSGCTLADYTTDM